MICCGNPILCEFQTQKFDVTQMTVTNHAMHVYLRKVIHVGDKTYALQN